MEQPVGNWRVYRHTAGKPCCSALIGSGIVIVMVIFVIGGHVCTEEMAVIKDIWHLST